MTIVAGQPFTIGDRVETGGIRGDVVDVSILRTTLMETGQWVKAEQYNGRIVRIANSDLEGKRSVQYALTGIKGISRRTAKIISTNAGLDPKATIGYLKDAELEKLQSSVDNITTIVPTWMVNKQNDIMSGEDRHLIGIDVMLGLNEDLNLMKKMRSYKGVRHDKGLRVRGQRTRSTGRKGRTVGVTRAAIQAKAAAAKEGEKKEEPKGVGK